jgi:rSAM/selenodomain-associated transferase 1
VIRTLIIFARPPVRGRVKTRLAKEIGPSRAAKFYRHCLHQTCRTLVDRRWQMELSITPDGGKIVLPLTVRPLKARPQGQGDLGQRMARALDRPGWTLVIGSDIPNLSRQHIARAFARMKGARIVLGPAQDGGYWAIGSRGRGRLKLSPVRWSSAHALEDTCRALAHVRIGFADRMQDVDGAQDYARLINRS